MDLLYLPVQIGFLLASLVTLYFLTRRIVYVGEGDLDHKAEAPWIIVLYPLLRESKATIRTTLIGHQRMDYPSKRWKMIAVLNWHDQDTIKSIHELMLEFPFLDILVMPQCDDPTWSVVWTAWDSNSRCYWWHRGKTRFNRDLPPKKTRQLIYAFYIISERMAEPWIVNYIDADSIPPPDHFRLAAAGLDGQCDFAQSTNIAGNLLDTEMSSLCAFDHMVWDGFMYPHMSSGHPYYCLGKGLFVRSDNVRDLGSWNPYITIEDPEFGLRFWKNGMKLGIIASPLIEEVPNSFDGWLHQRNRWMCGFFQTLGHPLTDLDFTLKEKILARMNLVPTLSLLLNTINVPLSLPVIYQVVRRHFQFPLWIDLLSAIDMTFLVAFLICFYVVAWRRSLYVRRSAFDSWRYLLRVNPVSVLIYWSLWSLPIVVGLVMCLTDRGKVWKRTEKIDANHDLVSDERALGGDAAVGLTAVDTALPPVLWRDG